MSTLVCRKKIFKKEENGGGRGEAIKLTSSIATFMSIFFVSVVIFDPDPA
jgi:hypothetical protein